MDTRNAGPPNTTQHDPSRPSEPQPIGALVSRMLADLDAEAADPDRQRAADEAARQRTDNERRRREESRQQAVSRLFDARGRRYEACTLDNFACDNERQTNALAAVKSYADRLAAHIRGGTSVLLYGPPGTGKDHLLAALMRRAVEAEYSVSWFAGMSLYGDWRDAISSEDTEARQRTRYTSPAVLAISDPLPPFGDLTPYQASKLFEVLDWRYSHCRATWLTMNVKSRDEAVKGLGAALVDRMRDGALIVPCDWESYRSRKV